MSAKLAAFALFDKHGPEAKNHFIAAEVRKQGLACALSSVNCYRCEWRKCNKQNLRNRRSPEEMAMARKNHAMRGHDKTLAMEDYIEEFAFADYSNNDVALLQAFAELMDKFHHDEESEIARKIVQRIERVEQRLKRVA